MLSARMVMRVTFFSIVGILCQLLMVVSRMFVADAIGSLNVLIPVFGSLRGRLCDRGRSRGRGRSRLFMRCARLVRARCWRDIATPLSAHTRPAHTPVFAPATRRTSPDMSVSRRAHRTERGVVGTAVSELLGLLDHLRTGLRGVLVKRRVGVGSLAGGGSVVSLLDFGILLERHRSVRMSVRMAMLYNQCERVVKQVACTGRGGAGQ